MAMVATCRSRRADLAATVVASLSARLADVAAVASRVRAIHLSNRRHFQW
jgi:hypothetical protein